MSNPEEIAQQCDLLTTHRRTLAYYLKQQAGFGDLYTPPAVAHGIDEARAQIRRIKQVLRDWNAPADEHPDDEPPALSRSAEPAPARTPQLQAQFGPGHVFLAYAPQDAAPLADQIAQQLRQAGFSTWHEPSGGSADVGREQRLEDAIRDCWLLLFLVTPEGIRSEACHQAWRRALSYKKPVVPLRFFSPGELPLQLRHRRVVDFSANFDTAVGRLCQYLSWMSGPEGELEVLRDRLDDLQREWSASPARVQAEIDELTRQIAYKERALRDPVGVRVENHDVTMVGLSADQQRFAATRAQDRVMTRRRLVGSPPRPSTNSFKDRERLGAEVLNALLERESDVRIVSVYGPAGVGKTALVCEIMSELERDRNAIHGLIYLSTYGGQSISLERLYLDSARMLGGASERALNRIWTTPQLSIATKSSYLIEQYGDKRCVILLDNLEELLDPDGRLTEPDVRVFFETFLSRQHSVRLLITSRQPLNLNADRRRRERRFRLAEGLPTQDAIDLLREFDPDGDLGLASADPELLRVVVEKTHGYPRALEAVAGILDQDRLRSLKSLLKDTELFNTEVVASLVREAQSRLDADARRVLWALAAFDRPVTEAAVSFLLQPFSQGVDIGATLRRLARGYYITVNRESGELGLLPQDREATYHQIPSDEASAPNLQALHRRAAEYFAQLRTPRASWKSIADLDPQLAEFEHRVKAADYPSAARLLNSIDADYLSPWGHVRRVAAMRQQLLGNLSDSRLAAMNLNGLGDTCLTLGQYEQAMEYHQQALAIAQAIGDRRAASQAIGNLGVAHVYLGQYDPAIDHYQQALLLACEAEDQRGQSEQLRNLARAYSYMGYSRRGVAYYQQALALARDIGDRRGEARALRGLGEIHQELGELESVVEYHQQALAIAQDLGDRYAETEYLSYLAGAYCDLARYDLALDYFEGALVVARAIGDRGNEGVCLGGLGVVSLALGNLQEAFAGLTAALAIAAELNNRGLLQQQGTLLALTYLRLNRPLDALNAVADALRYDTPWNNYRSQALAGIILARLGRAADAWQSFTRALVDANKLLDQTTRHTEASCTRGLALAGLALLSESDEREVFLTQAHEAYHEAAGAALGELAKAQQLLDELLPLDLDGTLAPLRAVLNPAREPN
jgi:tetratricopeptide (TPR) repeat protein